MSIFENKLKKEVPEIAKILARVSHHVHPKIVAKIVESNKKFKAIFEGFCDSKINLEDYFYEGSDCVFPATRRPINAEKKVDKWKQNINEKDGTILDDNIYPRHIWTHLAIGGKYSGGKNGKWSSSALDAFELAHIFAHKTDEIKLEKDVFGVFDIQSKPYALFTSASNVVLIPKGLPKPTDSLEAIKKVFYQRHQVIYGSFVKIPGAENFKKESIPKWYKDLEWNEPILPKNWEINIESLLEYRAKYLEDKYRNR
jgi:hypothetical protein